MSNRFIATALAASIALTTAFTAPARAADNGEIARFLLGAGALAVIATELSKNNRNRTRDTVVTRRYVEPPRHVQPTYRYNDDDYRVRPNRKVVPVACLRENNYRDGPRRYFGMRCLQNNMRHANRLPGQCQTSVWGRNGWRTVYAARCLRQNGWVFG